MTDDLVKRLRDAGRAFINNQYNLHTRAADRIEELEAALDDIGSWLPRSDWHHLKPETKAALEKKDD